MNIHSNCYLIGTRILGVVIVADEDDGANPFAINDAMTAREVRQLHSNYVIFVRNSQEIITGLLTIFHTWSRNEKYCDPYSRI